MKVADFFWFRPFESRQDAVVGFRFRYDKKMVAAIKRIIRAHNSRVVDSARRIYHAGGWLPEHKCWFVEEPVLPAVLDAFRAAGYEIRWFRRPEDASGYRLPGPVAEFLAELERRYGLEPGALTGPKPEG